MKGGTEEEGWLRSTRVEDHQGLNQCLGGFKINRHRVITKFYVFIIEPQGGLLKRKVYPKKDIGI